jgi:transcriptional regulator with XRE-family HTH domain
VDDLSTQQFYKLVGGRIRELRGSKMSQEALASAASLSRTSIVNIEAGRQRLLLHNLFEISKALGIKASDLLSPLERSTTQDVDLSSAGDAAEWIQRSLRKIPNPNPQND